MENSIEETIKQLKLMLKVRKEQKEIIECAGGSCINCDPDIKALSESIDILSDYKRVLKINEELQEEFKQIYHELETYYNITKNDETLKVIGKRYMLWNIQRQVYALKLKGRTVTEEWLIDILDSLEKMQLIEEDNWDTKKYIESEIEQDMIRESKILNKRIRGLIK